MRFMAAPFCTPRATRRRAHLREVSRSLSHLDHREISRRVPARALQFHVGMGWFDVAKDLVGFGLGETEKKVVGIADLVGDGAAAGYDALTGDTEHAKEHAKDAAWDAGGLVAPPGLGTLMDVYGTTQDVKNAVQDTAENKVDHDEGGTGAKWGAIAGLALGPLGAAEGAALGGYLGHKLTPTMAGNDATKNAGDDIGKAAQLAFGHYTD